MLKRRSFLKRLAAILPASLIAPQLVPSDPEKSSSTKEPDPETSASEERSPDPLDVNVWPDDAGWGPTPFGYAPEYGAPPDEAMARMREHFHRDYVQKFKKEWGDPWGPLEVTQPEPLGIPQPHIIHLASGGIAPELQLLPMPPELWAAQQSALRRMGLLPLPPSELDPTKCQLSAETLNLWRQT